MRCERWPQQNQSEIGTISHRITVTRTTISFGSSEDQILLSMVSSVDSVLSIHVGTEAVVPYALEVDVVAEFFE